MIKKCTECKKDFEAEKDDVRAFCSEECKKEALAKFDANSDECLSCQ